MRAADGTQNSTQTFSLTNLLTQVAAALNILLSTAQSSGSLIDVFMRPTSFNLSNLEKLPVSGFHFSFPDLLFF
jgi:hypothetical protein